MAKLAIWISVAPLALLVFLLVWRSLAADSPGLSKKSVDSAVGAGRPGQIVIESAPWRREVTNFP